MDEAPEVLRRLAPRLAPGSLVMDTCSVKELPVRWMRELLPPAWVAEIRRPCAINPEYGLLWWLNTGRQQLPSAPESSYAAKGAGSNLIWIDPEHDLVTVVRWIDKASLDGFVAAVLASVMG